MFKVPLSLILRKVKFHYELGDKLKRLNYLLFVDDLKIFAKSENQIDPLLNTVYLLSEDIGMEFGIKKCGILTLKRGKVDKVKSRGLNLPDGELMKTIDEEGYNYLEILEYKRRIRLILISKLNGKTKIKAINSWAVEIWCWSVRMQS